MHRQGAGGKSSQVEGAKVLGQARSWQLRKSTATSMVSRVRRGAGAGPGGPDRVLPCQLLKILWGLCVKQGDVGGLGQRLSDVLAGGSVWLWPVDTCGGGRSRDGLCRHPGGLTVTGTRWSENFS